MGFYWFTASYSVRTFTDQSPILWSWSFLSIQLC